MEDGSLVMIVSVREVGVVEAEVAAVEVGVEETQHPRVGGGGDEETHRRGSYKNTCVREVKAETYAVLTCRKIV